MTALIHQLRTERADLLATASQREATGQPGTARLYRATAALTQYHLDELAPRILPDDMDDLLDERAFAHVMVTKAWFRHRIPLTVVRRQGDYARRLDALAAQRGQE